MDSLVPVLVCVLVVATFGALMLSVAHLLGAKSKVPLTKAKSLPYECGIEGQEQDTSPCACTILPNSYFVYFI